MAEYFWGFLFVFGTLFLGVWLAGFLCAQTLGYKTEYTKVTKIVLVAVTITPIRRIIKRGKWFILGVIFGIALMHHILNR